MQWRRERGKPHARARMIDVPAAVASRSPVSSESNADMCPQPPTTRLPPSTCRRFHARLQQSCSPSRSDLPRSLTTWTSRRALPSLLLPSRRRPPRVDAEARAVRLLRVLRMDGKQESERLLPSSPESFDNGYKDDGEDEAGEAASSLLPSSTSVEVSPWRRTSLTESPDFASRVGWRYDFLPLVPVIVSSAFLPSRPPSSASCLTRVSRDLVPCDRRPLSPFSSLGGRCRPSRCCSC